LMHLARLGELDAVRLRVDAGASANKQDNQRRATPLIYAAENGHTEIVTLLLNSGADPQIKLASGSTFLHAAVGGHALDIVHFALDAGLEVNAESGDGLTPLRIAAWSRSPRLLRLLIDHGVDVNAKTTSGLTALIAVTTDDQSFRPAHAECTTLLVEHGADVNVQDGEGSTPLMGAAFYGDLEVVRYLHEHGAKLNVVDGRGRTATNKAQTAGKLEIASFLTPKSGKQRSRTSPNAVTGLRSASSSASVRSTIEAGSPNRFSEAAATPPGASRNRS
jgi:ankyrin repeat protein